MTFEELVHAAYMARVQLSAAGFYKTPKIHWDRKSGRGHPFYYFAYGAAVSEVAIDTLTGEYRVERVDILHDCGNSLNPAIDRGQIEGGFVQGMGWLTTEELWFDKEGRLRTHAPSTYKIPVASDRPRVFNVEFFDGGGNREPTVGRSKAVGEPPLMLAISVLHALSDAVASIAEHRFCPCLDTPATPERVLFAVEEMKAKAATLRCEAVAVTRLAPIIREALGSGVTVILVTVARAEGSTPREAGAIMLVTREASHGTIGGGQLEFHAIDVAREMIADRTKERRLDLPLGPHLGQCCGGRVELLLRPAIKGCSMRSHAGRKARRKPRLTCCSSVQAMWASLSRARSLRCRLWSPCSTTATAFLRRCRNRRFQAPRRSRESGRASARRAPPSSSLTHSHALDYRLADAALRQRRRPLCRHDRLRRQSAPASSAGSWRGAAPSEALARFTCPIGGKLRARQASGGHRGARDRRDPGASPCRRRARGCRNEGHDRAGRGKAKLRGESFRGGIWPKKPRGLSSRGSPSASARFSPTTA